MAFGAATVSLVVAVAWDAQQWASWRTGRAHFRGRARSASHN